jgi:hypothetical protein
MNNDGQRFAHRRMPYHLRLGRFTLSIYKDWIWEPTKVRGTDRQHWVHVAFFTIAWRV